MFHRHKKAFEYSIFSILSLIFIAATTLFTYQYAYAGKIYRNVYFGDIDLSGKTRKQAEYILKDKFNNLLNREITLIANGKEVKVKIEDTGISFDFAKIAKDCYEIGRKENFWKNIQSSTLTIYRKIPVNASPYLDETAYNNFLSIAIGQLNTNPKDATLTIENGTVRVTESYDGHHVITSDLIDEIIDLANSDRNIISLDTIPTRAVIKSADFGEAIEQANSYLAKKYIFSYNNQNYSPTDIEVGNWVEFKNNNGDFTAIFNDSNVKAYLNKIAKNFEVIAVDRKINAGTNAVIQEGRAGIFLDKDSAVSNLLNQLNNTAINVILTTNTIEPKEVKIFPNEGLVPGRFEGKYLDIDLTHQKACQIEGMNVINCFIISSGKPGMATPTGTFHVTSKDPRKWSTTYGLWMPYWQQFSGPYGLHELPEWPNGYKEGQDHLGTPVSHGCVRFGIGDAATVFNFTQIGTPIYIHK